MFIINRQGSCIEKYQKCILEWYKKKEFKEIELTEKFLDENKENGYADYQIVYAAVFEPKNNDLEKARLEIWISSECKVGIGYEKVWRVAKRIGVRPFWNFQKEQFAAGYEPHTVKLKALQLLLDIVACGDIALKPFVLLNVLWEIKAITKQENIALLKQNGYEFVPWLKSVRKSDFEKNSRLLHYKPWR